MGGGQTREQENKLRSGIHIIVATPGRLLHFLNSKRMTLTLCKYFVMDEADRLIDLGFEEGSEIFFCPPPRNFAILSFCFFVFSRL
jgi:superfamily II DNA/RNA helicase